MSLLELVLAFAAKVLEILEPCFLLSILISDGFFEVLNFILSLFLLLSRLLLVFLEVFFFLISDLLELGSPRLEHPQLLFNRHLFLKRCGKLREPQSFQLFE